MADMPLKVLHFGDVFLDCPFSGLSAAQSQERRRETRNTFLRAVKYAQEQEMGLVLITGNLVDHNYATLDTLKLLVDAFASAPKCQFVICPGPHDPMTEDSIYRLGTFPENVTIFDSVEPSVKRFDTLGVSVIGWAFGDRTYAGSPLAGTRPTTEAGDLVIVAGYATDGGMDGTAPTSVTQIGAFGGDYAALSGGNLFDGFHRVNTTTYAYSGALEHASYEEPGFGGANLITLNQVMGVVRVETARVDFGCRRYALEQFDVTGVTGPSEVLNKITEVIRERGYGKETALKVILVGYTPMGFAIPKSLTADTFGLYVFELEDRTLPAFDESTVARDMTVKGEVCRTLLPKMRGGTDAEQQGAAYALRVALGALEGKDISQL